MNVESMKKTFFNNIKGIMLFEVLIAVLVLAIGITGSLRSLSYIVEITKRSRDLFEAQMVAHDFYFTLFACPEKFNDEFSTSGELQYAKATHSFTKDYECMFDVSEVPLLYDDQDEEVQTPKRVIATQRVPQAFRTVNLTVTSPEGVLFENTTFHSFIPKEEGA